MISLINNPVQFVTLHHYQHLKKNLYIGIFKCTIKYEIAINVYAFEYVIIVNIIIFKNIWFFFYNL